MPRFIVLLRGVNVGKGNRVPMAEFKSLLEGLGYADVATLLNSGNAVFTSGGRSTSKISSAIASALTKSLAVNVPIVVHSAAELAAIITGNPLAVPAADHSKFLVAFASDPAALERLKPWQSLAKPPERFVVGEQAAYLHCPQGVLESKVGAALVGPAGKSVTTRNWATVLKLATLAGVSAA